MENMIFAHRDYKVFLKSVLDEAPQQGRGLRQKFAQAASCQLPYVSHVLNGDYHFSAEQIDGIARFLELRESEREFLLTLVQYERAGTPTLKSFYKKRLDEIANLNSSIKDRLKTQDSISDEDRGIYYSNWLYSAIHMLVAIPDFQTKSQIAKRLHASSEKIDDAIDFLITRGLIELNAGRLKPRLMDLHLDHKSPHINQHHTNWRLKSIESMNDQSENDLHYSLAFTAKNDDLPKIREVLLHALKSCASLIRPSKEEDLAALCVDLFRIK